MAIDITVTTDATGFLDQSEGRMPVVCSACPGQVIRIGSWFDLDVMMFLDSRQRRGSENRKKMDVASSRLVLPSHSDSHVFWLAQRSCCFSIAAGVRTRTACSMPDRADSTLRLFGSRKGSVSNQQMTVPTNALAPAGPMAREWSSSYETRSG